MPPDEEENSRDSFQEERLRRLSSPEELDSMLQVVSKNTWIALATVAVLLFILILWSFFGSIPIKVHGRGIIIREKGLFNIQSRAEGTVQAVHVRRHQQLSKGDLILEVSSPQEELRLETAKLKYRSLERNFKALREQILLEESARRAAIERDITAKKFAIQQAQSELEPLTEDVERKKRLFDEGLVTARSLRESEEKLANKRVEIESISANIEALKSDLAKRLREEELKAKEQELLSAEEAVELQQIRSDFGQVRSPYDGSVLEVLVNEGDLVKSGDSVVWAEFNLEPGETHLIYGFVPVEEGKRIKVGSSVHMELSTVEAPEYGMLLGKVVEVSRYAISQGSVGKRIQNPGLVQYLLGDRAMVLVVIEPIKDPSTPSGYAWTSGKGPPFEITSGTVCEVKAITERRRPIYYIFPIWRLEDLGVGVDEVVEIQELKELIHVAS